MYLDYQSMSGTKRQWTGFSFHEGKTTSIHVGIYNVKYLFQYVRTVRYNQLTSFLIYIIMYLF